MKRVVLAIAGAGLVVAAIAVARANSGEDSTPDAQPPSTSAPGEHAKLQAEQLEQAREDIRKQVEEYSRQLRQSQGVPPDSDH